MTTRHLAADFWFTGASGATDDDFDAFSDRVMDALCDLEEIDEGIFNPDMTGRLTERWLSVSLGIEADSADDAVRLFLANVRTALHAAGCSTPGWPTAFRPKEWNPATRPLELA